MEELVLTFLITFFSIIMSVSGDSDISSDDLLTPQKQFKLGIDIQEIECKESLFIIVKYDGTPACVTEKTQTELIKRGWTDSQSVIVFDNTMESQYFSKYQTFTIEANTKISKQLVCPLGYYLISGSIKPQDNLDIGYGMQKIHQDGQLGWQFNIENRENKISLLKIQIDCSTDSSQHKYIPPLGKNEIKL